MFTLSAFADEISPDPAVQVAVLRAANVHAVEFRSIHATNVLKLPDAAVADYLARLEAAGLHISAVASPIGKYPIDQPLEPQQEALKHAADLAHRCRTSMIRIFSFYPPEGVYPPESKSDHHWQPHRQRVLDRLHALAEIAHQHDVMLVHENEHRIYGDSPERVLDIMHTVNHPHLRLVYDAANYVVCGHDPKAAWEATREHTVHFHIKDWTAGAAYGCLPGHGDGQIPCSIYDAVKRGYRGYATLEPHLRGGGPSGGHTGPDLFPIAVEAFRQILRLCNGREAFPGVNAPNQRRCQNEPGS